MSFTSRRCASASGLLPALLAVAAFSASCGTEGDDTLGVSLIQDRGERKAIRFVAVAAETTISFQATSAASDAPTASSVLVSARPGYQARSLLRFGEGLPAAGTVVDSAMAVLPIRDAYGTSPFSLSFHRVIEDWTESPIAPDSFPAFEVAPLLSIDVPHGDAAPETLTIRLDAITQTWVGDPANNFGLALVASPGEDGELELDARESTRPPRLVVHWTVGGADTTVTLAPVGDLFSLGTTAGFVPLSDTPRRVVVARGLAARTFVKFAWPDPGPRATIHRAELTLHVDPALSAARSFAVGVRRILSEPWSGFDTSVDAAFGQGVPTLSAAVDSVVIDVTDLFLAVLSAENHGFEIRALDERSDTDYLRFHAYDTETPPLAPSLRIWYTPGDLPEDAP